MCSAEAEIDSLFQFQEVNNEMELSDSQRVLMDDLKISEKQVLHS